MKRVIVSVWVVLALLVALAGCGGKKSSSTTTTSKVTVTLAPTAATLSTGATQQFTPTVSNTTNTAVNWSVNGVAGGNQTVGFISTTGLYTAPNTVPTPATVSVTAVSQADTTVSVTAAVTITAPATPTANLVVSPSAVTLPAAGQQKFTATVSGSPIAVNWTANCQSGGACGSIGADGTYTAPLAPPPGGNVSITATAQNNSVPAAGAVVTVQFSNGTLNGQYAFSFSGQSAGVPFLAAGSITFDGNGNITGGTEDIGGGGAPLTITGGTYHVGTDGRGNASLATSAGTAAWQFTVVNQSHGFVIRFDNGVPSASGTMDLQNGALIATGLAAFKGNYAFNLSNTAPAPGSLAAAGALVSDGAGGISSGAMDVNSAGVPSSLSLSPSTFAAPTSSGRGTMQLISTLGTQTFAYYIVAGSPSFVGATHIKVVEIDGVRQLGGDLFMQPTPAAGSFDKTSFKGGFAFVILGASGTAAFGEGGVITLDGAGNVTGTIDTNANGTFKSGAVSGTYTVTDPTTGRATATLTVAGSALPLQFALYPQINGALSMVEIDASNTVAGRALVQSGGPFSNGSLLGNYALNLSGTDFIPSTGEEDLVGQIVPNGGTAMTGTVIISDNNVNTAALALSASYSVSSTGRGSATLTTNSTSNFNFYLADSGDVLFLESDSNGVLIGVMQKQF